MTGQGTAELPRGETIRTQALDAARATWPRLADIAGLSAASYRLSVLSARAEPEGRMRVVAAATAAGADRVVLKFRVNGDVEAALRMAEAHRSAARALADVPDCAAPDVLAFDPDAGAALLAWVDGGTVQDALSEGRIALGDLAAHVGRWMAALNRQSTPDQAAFDGAWMLRRLDLVDGRGVGGAHLRAEWHDRPIA